MVILFVIIFDKIVLSTLYYKFTILEKHATTSGFQFSYALKLAIGLFFTTAIMTLAVEAFYLNNYYSHPYGVIDEETVMFLLNSFFIPIFWFINPFRIVKQIKRKLYKGKRSLTQAEANALMEEEQYDMGKRFAEVVEMMWFTFLYSTLIPVGAPITCAGLCLYYWIDKYNLLRRSAVNGQISGKLINTMLALLDLTLLLRPLGSLLFDSQIRSHTASSAAMVAVALLFALLPKDRLIDFFNSEKFRLETKTYDEVRNTFHQTYHTEHPIYKIMHR